MKFTIAALLVASSSAVTIQGDWKSTGLPYDFDEPTRDKASAHATAMTHAFNGATKAHDEAAAAQAAANAAAGASKAKASADFAATSYKDKAAFGAAEATNGAAVKAKEASLDAHLKAFDDKVAKDLV